LLCLFAEGSIGVTKSRCLGYYIVTRLRSVGLISVTLGAKNKQATEFSYVLSNELPS
jgi:hypothetical protein